MNGRPEVTLEASSTSLAVFCQIAARLVSIVIVYSTYLILFFPQVKLGLMLPINDEIKDLRKLLSSYTGIPESSMLITEITDDGFQRTFPGECSATIIIHARVTIRVLNCLPI